MFVYADTSAILALLVDGRGTALAVRVWDGAAAVACGRFTDVELVAELTRAVHGGDLTGADGVRALAAWRRYRLGVRWVEVTETLTTLAADLALEQELSTTAAMHVASAWLCAGGKPPRGQDAARPVGECLLLTMEPRTARAAQAVGLTVLTPPVSVAPSLRG